MALNITPHKGIGSVHFGLDETQIVSLIGEPQEKETISNAADEETTVMRYIELGITLFLEGSPMHLRCIDCSNSDATLFNQQIFNSNEKEIVSLMVKNNYFEQDISNEDWGERRVSFPESNVDFYFSDGSLISVVFGE